MTFPLDVIRAGVVFPIVDSSAPAVDPRESPTSRPAAEASPPASAAPTSRQLASGHGAQGDPETGPWTSPRETPARESSTMGNSPHSSTLSSRVSVPPRAGVPRYEPVAATAGVWTPFREEHDRWCDCLTRAARDPQYAPCEAAELAMELFETSPAATGDGAPHSSNQAMGVSPESNGGIVEVNGDSGRPASSAVGDETVF